MPLEKIVKIEGRGVYVSGNDIDTDRIIPARFMKCVTFDGLGQYLFYDVRFQKDGSLKNHPLNDPKHKGASILLSGRNFGCGSSREAAVWSLQEMGIRAIIGSGFGDIFFANCFQNGILPIVVDKEIVDGLAAEVESTQGAGRMGIDLQEQTITSPSGVRHRFEIDPRRRAGLLEGLDEIALTLRREHEIQAFQASDRAGRPWIHFARKPA